MIALSAGAAGLLNGGPAAAATASPGTVVIGPCTFTPWAFAPITIPAGGSLILTQTGGPGPSPCNTSLTGDYNLDTSESPNQSRSNPNCTPPTPVFPEVNLTINNVALALVDNGQVLNTGGIDHGVCGGNPNETREWVLDNNQAGTAGFNIYFGYTDSYRPGGTEPEHPAIWEGSTNPVSGTGAVTFVGCNAHTPSLCPTDAQGRDLYDAGAIRIDNLSTQPITVSAQPSVAAPSPTPVPTTPTPVPSSPTPLASSPTPVPSSPTPLVSSPTPLVSSPTPVPSSPTPLAGVGSPGATPTPGAGPSTSASVPVPATGSRQTTIVPLSMGLLAVGLVVLGGVLAPIPMRRSGRFRRPRRTRA